MKIIITEDQNKILWLKRRISQQHPLLRDIIVEGFEYTNACDYNYPGGDKEYLEEILRDSSGTFVNSFEELYKVENDVYGVLSKLTYDYIKDNYEKTILDFFYDYIQHFCDEN
jgi:hypothetical protein